MKALLKKIYHWSGGIVSLIKIKKALREQQEVKIVVGSAGIHDKGWIATSMTLLDLTKPEEWKKILPEKSVSAILAEHVWEHLDKKEARIATQTCYRFLKPGGYARIAVPDGNHPDPKYLEYVRPGGTGVGADDHKELYTNDKLAAVFSTAGFKVKSLEYFDQKGKFHFANWEPIDGKIHRSKRFDKRNKHGQLNYTSIIIDAVKPK